MEKRKCPEKPELGTANWVIWPARGVCDGIRIFLHRYFTPGFPGKGVPVLSTSLSLCLPGDSVTPETWFQLRDTLFSLWALLSSPTLQ